MVCLLIGFYIMCKIRVLYLLNDCPIMLRSVTVVAGRANNKIQEFEYLKLSLTPLRPWLIAFVASVCHGRRNIPNEHN